MASDGKHEQGRNQGKSGIRWPGKGISWKEFLTALKKEYATDALGDVAGNLVFAGILALFPFVIFLVALGSAIMKPQDVEQVVGMLSKVAPPAATQILSKQMHSLVSGSHGGLLTVGVVGAFWSASGGITTLMRALNTIYGVKEGRPFWKVRGIAILATAITAALALIAAVVAVVVPTIAHLLPSPLGTLFLWLRFPLAGLLMMFLWAMLYYWLPDVEQQFRFITPGSVIGVVIWALASWGFSVYVSHFGKYDATYGALGGVVVLLVWMWISAQVVLLGAEINEVLEAKSPDGKRAGAKSLAEKGVSGTKTEEIEHHLGGAAPIQAKVAGRHGEVGEATAPQARHRGPRDLNSTPTKIWAAIAALSFFRSRRHA